MNWVFGIVYVSIYTIHDVFVYRVPNSDQQPCISFQFINSCRPVKDFVYHSSNKQEYVLNALLKYRFSLEPSSDQYPQSLSPLWCSWYSSRATLAAGSRALQRWLRRSTRCALLSPRRKHLSPSCAWRSARVPRRRPDLPLSCVHTCEYSVGFLSCNPHAMCKWTLICSATNYTMAS